MRSSNKFLASLCLAASLATGGDSAAAARVIECTVHPAVPDAFTTLQSQPARAGDTNGVVTLENGFIAVQVRDGV